jgi:hypothetical protein
MTIKNAQRRFFLIAAVVIVVIYFGPGIVATLIRASARGSEGGMAKPSPSHPLPVAPAVLPQTAPPSPASSGLDPAQYLGVWIGSALMPDAAQETCKIRLELARNATDPQKLTGYESKSCVPTPILQGGRVTRESIPDLIRQTRPIEAVLTGSVQDGEIVFQVDKTIGTPPPGSCGALKSFSLTPFGREGVTAQWQEGQCQAYEMNLTKARG